MASRAARDPRGIVWAALLLAPLAISCAPSLAVAQETDWPFDDQYESRLVYLHALVNYAFNPYWERDWERHLLSGNAVRFTVGSITSRDFLTEAVVSVDERLGATRFRLLYRMDWLEAQHLDVGGIEQFAGLEMSVAGPLGALALIQPTADKELVDVAFGLVLADPTRERYLRASLRFDDVAWGQKNDRGGESVRTPLALQWTGRHDVDPFELFTQGRLSRTWERVFPDTAASPEISAETQGVSWASLRARYLTRRGAFAELRLGWYDFEDSQLGRDPTASHGYGNRRFTLTALYAFAFGGGAWRAWPGVQLLRQDAAADGRRDYDFERVDWMPTAFVEYFPSASQSIELGYMASASDRTLSDTDPSASFDDVTYSDKVKVGWTYHFSPLSRLQLSLSHELAFGRFGGGNVQVVTFF